MYSHVLWVVFLFLFFFFVLFVCLFVFSRLISSSDLLVCWFLSCLLRLACSE